MDSLRNQVRQQYERYPYPHYPLIAVPRISQGYLGSCYFARSLCKFHAIDQRSVGQRIDVAVLGCGEMLPVALRQFDPTEVHFTFVDFSKPSLRRARFRLIKKLCTGYELIEKDLDDYLWESDDDAFHHLDAYGVLHHLPDPEKTLLEIFRVLKPGGTARIMFYNTPQRNWIHKIQDEFKSRGFSHLNKADVRKARQHLYQTAKNDPSLAQNLAAIGRNQLNQDSHFVDRFLHAHELQASPNTWAKWIEVTGFKLVGVLDRYGEMPLGKLPLPLPGYRALGDVFGELQASQFKNNYEIWLQKPFAPSSRPLPKKDSSAWTYQRLRWVAPPHHWFGFEETETLSLLQRQKVWAHFLCRLFNPQKPLPKLNFDKNALQRLKSWGAYAWTD